MKRDYKTAVRRILDNSKTGVSFDSDQLIAEVKTDIVEFGAGREISAWIDPKDNFVKDYDFAISREGDKELELLNDDEFDTINSFWNIYKDDDIYIMELYQLLTILEIQNTILGDYNFLSKKARKSRASKGGSGFWANLSPDERSRIARERGKAGAAKRWGKVAKK